MNSILQKIDKSELKELIASIRELESEFWMKGEKVPEEVIRALNFLGGDTDVVEHLKQMSKNLQISEMNVQQIQTKLTNILHLSKFCDSIEEELHNGNILKLLLRLEELVNA